MKKGKYMSKKEFLKQLENKLSEALPSNAVQEHIYYYNDYIDNASREGKKEEEVIAELGDPILIARTILETNPHPYPEEDMTSFDENHNPFDEDSSESQDLESQVRRQKMGCLIAFAGILAVLLILIWLLGAVMRILLPILIPVLVILLVIQLFKRR